MLLKWSIDWQMKFNVDKCKILKVGKSLGDTRYKLHP